MRRPRESLARSIIWTVVSPHLACFMLASAPDAIRFAAIRDETRTSQGAKLTTIVRRRKIAKTPESQGRVVALISPHGGGWVRPIQGYDRNPQGTRTQLKHA
jgi:hypothetical protein